MQAFINSVSRIKYQIALLVLIVTASVISLTLQQLHVLISDSHDYSFFPINLGLAWIPFLAAGVAYLSMRSRLLFLLAMPICTLVWLVYFPNAPYLLTDFQHLATPSSDSPLWFDVILFIWFAWTGLLLGIASLSIMQEIVTRKINAATGWIFAIGATILSSVGVYLGRFLRWNSWNLLQDPLPIAKDMYEVLRHPIANMPTYVFMILFTLLFLLIYLTFHLFGGILREVRPQSARTILPDRQPD